MLDDYKQMYIETANIISGWKDMSRDDLCRKYVELKAKNDSKCDCYLSAIICKFWNTISQNYNGQQFKLATEEDCYDWLISSVLYALEKHVWDDPSSTLYNDEHGPEKAINVRINSLRLNFYESYNKQKRCLNRGAISLDLIEEEENHIGEDDGKISDFSEYILSDRVKEAFNKKSYLKAFVLDGIVNSDCFELNDSDETINFNVKKLKKHLRYLSEDYASIFADRYNLDKDAVLKSITYINTINYVDLETRVNNIFGLLKHDDELLKWLRNK